MPKAPSQRGLSPKATGGVSADTPSGSLRSPAPPRGRQTLSVCSLRSQPAPPKGELLARRPQASSPSQSPAVTDSPFCRYATSSPGAGEVFPQRESLWRNRRLCNLPDNFPAMPKAPSQRGLSATNGSRLGDFRQLPSQSAHCVRSQLPLRGSWHGVSRD